MAVSSNSEGAASSITSAPVASAAGTSASLSVRAATLRAPAWSAQIAARWLLPEPSGPTSATVRLGQSGQLSISVNAAAFEGPPRKSSRA